MSQTRTLDEPTTTLSPLVRRIFVGVAFSCVGSGLTVPFLYVYLSQERHLATEGVGLMFAWMGLISCLLSPLGGTLIDRLGPRPVIVWGLAIEAASALLLARVTTQAQAYAVATLLCLGQVGMHAATSALLARLVPPERRERVFGYQFMLLNAGLGVGGLIGSALIVPGRVSSYQRLYAVDAATYLVYLAVMLSLPRGTGRAAVAEDEDGPQLGWGHVLRDRRLVAIIALSVVVLTFGYAQVETGFPAYVTDVAGMDPRHLGLAFGANTAAVVGAQLVALRLIRGRRRSTMLAVCAATWSLAWAVVACCALVHGWLAVACIVVGMAVFGAGETLWAPVSPALVNELAHEELRGRYNALLSMTWTVAGIAGPGVGGVLIGHHLGGLWAGLTVGGCALAALLFPLLRRSLTDAEDGLGAGGLEAG